MPLQFTVGGVSERWIRGDHSQARADEPSEVDGDARLKTFLERFRRNFLNDCTGRMGWCHGYWSISKRPVDCPGQYNSKGRNTKADNMAVHGNSPSNQWLHFDVFLSMAVKPFMKPKVRSIARTSGWF